MKKWTLFFIAIVVLAGTTLRAQDVIGTWQGTLKAQKDLRTILVVSRANGKLKATMYSIDQGSMEIKASSVTQDGATLKYTVDLIGGSYEGKLSRDGNTITGEWTQGPTPLPLVFTRATKATAWEIPAPPPPTKMMPADANPSFEVATIKPNDTGATSMQQLSMNGRNFQTRASSLQDLIEFAYQVQAKQIVGEPEWMSTTRYDVAGVPDVEGAPNPEQMRMMIGKLLADRFQLKFHHAKRTMSAFVMTTAKGGEKLKATQMTEPLPGIGMRPAQGGLTLMFRSCTINDFTEFLQSMVLDRPVVNDTNLKGRYDLSLTFLPDETEFNGRSPVGKVADGVEAAPSLFEALQQQEGLKLNAEKADVDVLVIDHVDKPSAN